MISSCSEFLEKTVIVTYINKLDEQHKQNKTKQTDKKKTELQIREGHIFIYPILEKLISEGWCVCVGGRVEASVGG